MLGPLTALPLLKGWDYRFRDWTRTVTKGDTVDIARLSATGWLQGLLLVTDDCYAGYRFSWQGAGLELTEFNTYPEGPAQIGAFAQDPAGWLQRYYRPNPNSTAGIFTFIYSFGYQGFSLPYVPDILLKFFLRDESTQDSATIYLNAFNIEITDTEQFIRSLRAVLGQPIIQKIDPNLLTVGLGEIRDKGPLEELAAEIRSLRDEIHKLNLKSAQA